MPLLEVNQIRYISSSVRLDDSTASQVDQYAAFAHAHAQTMSWTRCSLCLLNEPISRSFSRRHRPSRLPPHCVSAKPSKWCPRSNRQRSLHSGVEAASSARVMKA
jgi:hypothetical protein